jgi:RNA 3'-terminal phosphate cyclase (ATP)
MLSIDGSMGEGGGQILRTSLALSLVTGTPFRLTNIRSNRSKPGLLRQHLAAVKAAATLGAEVDGCEIGARELVVRPGSVRGGEYVFGVGSAGSACLVLQTVLPPLLASGEAARLRLEGGTHNPFAPPFDFVERVFIAVLRRMGARVDARLGRWGFYPAGGGILTVDVKASPPLQGLEHVERGEMVSKKGRAVVAHLSGDIAKRELAVVKAELGWADGELELAQVSDSDGPGNILLLEIESEYGREMCAGFGERGVSAEAVAHRAIAELRRYLQSSAPVGRRLADQLMIPFALAGNGVFRTSPLSEHSSTNLEVIRKFVNGRIDVRERGDDVFVEFGGSR